MGLHHSCCILLFSTERPFCLSPFRWTTLCYRVFHWLDGYRYSTYYPIDSYFGFCSHKQCSNVCVYEHSCTYIWMYFCGVNSYLWNYMNIMWNLKSGECFLITLQKVCTSLYSPQCMSILCTISSTLISKFKKFAGEKEGVLLLFCFLSHEWEKASFKIFLGSCIFFFLISEWLVHILCLVVCWVVFTVKIVRALCKLMSPFLLDVLK